ncbi:MAG: SDR family NAD(P)-dependent oxidoreductase [Verrucomicrobiales bacterium]|nr:SDR family NAD(P)-dependent oxidoreductase [Verrucomicrobiales bacterium]
MKLSGKNVLVTGGGSGIGLGIARCLAVEGASVVICGRREAVLAEAAASIPATPPVRWRACDVSDRPAVVALFEWLTTEGVQPDVIVHCAGANVLKRTLADMDPADFDRIVSINAGGAFNIMHTALPAMRARGDGLIINIVSVAGRRLFPLSGAPYSASKFAQAALGSFVNFEAAAEGVRVTNIYPGEVNTPILEKRPVVPPPEQRAKMLQPEDFGELVVALIRLPGRALVSDVVITPTYMPQA